MKSPRNRAAVAWVLAAVYYFYQYALRAAPSVMMPELSAAFGLSVAGVASLAGIFYYGYSPFSLVAGSAMDRLGARATIPVGAFLTGAGTLLFGTGSVTAAYAGRFLQGAGGVFGLVGAVYIASRHFPASRAATLIGATQMFGMLGGAAGQVAVGPLIAAGLHWSSFWIGAGLLGLLLAVALYRLLPGRERDEQLQGGFKAAAATLAVVFRNPQSILCGLIAGLLFIPTTIFDMIWGVRYLQEAHGLAYGDAVMRSATVPLGWIVGCPLLGMLSDRIGRRRPVIIGGAAVLLVCLVWILYGPHTVLPPYALGAAAGVASGAAMLPYTVIKEANPPQFGGTATGAVSFLNLTSSALAGPVFGWLMERVAAGQPAALTHYQTTFQPLLYGVGVAILLTFVLKETGPAARTSLAPAGKLEAA